MKFKVEIAKRGQASCKYGKCKGKIEKGILRIGKISPSPFAEGSEMTQWFHAKCLFDQMANPRATKLESVDELDGFDELEDSDKQLIQEYFHKMAGSQTPNSQKKRSNKSNKSTDRDDEDETPKKKKKSSEKKSSRRSTKKNEAKEEEGEENVD